MSGFSPQALGAVVALAVFVLDQLTKWWILAEVMDPQRPIAIAPFLNIVLVYNRGVSFGVFGGAPAWMPWLLTLFALAIATGLGIWLRRAEDRLLATGLGLVIGGAIGNVVDRVRFGAVVDFIDVHAAGWHFPAFNVADSGITIGVGLLLLDALKSERQTP